MFFSHWLGLNWELKEWDENPRMRLIKFELLQVILLKKNFYQNRLSSVILSGQCCKKFRNPPKSKIALWGFFSFLLEGRYLFVFLGFFCFLAVWFCCCRWICLLHVGEDIQHRRYL